MRVLLACEQSGEVREAFAARGHDAWSADILPTDRPGQHIQGDVRDVLFNEWDLILGFPPCTCLTKVSARWWPAYQADGRQQAAIEFFRLFTELPCPRVVIENPAGIMSRVYRRPDQYIQPWHHGHPWTKTTGLWLKGVPPLRPTDIVPPRGPWVQGSPKRQGDVWEGAALAAKGDRSRERSKTFPGIARAMAAQWG